MKRTSKKPLLFATAVAILFFAAPGAQARGVHDIRTENSNVSDYSSAKKFSGTQANKKFIAHKKRKSFKGKKPKDRSTSDFSMVTQKDV
ncbi:MAG: hypothetical protein C0469_01140 [Cyanobacteria bacterium DS2.3.42]|nr:hypothetical protein [Cyanobacteria bacterium DS2.3.42]